MYTSVKQLLDAIASGKEPILDDEYVGEDGLPYCNACKTARVYISPGFVCRSQCQCQTEAIRKEYEAEERRKRIEEYKRRQEQALLNERYKGATFEKAVITESNREAYEKCRNYVKNAQEMISHNIGLYIYGDNSSGKTHLTACICNALLWQGYRCIHTSLAMILNEIRSSYDGDGIGESELIRRLQFCDFAFVDDLGKEFMGKETKWAEKKLFEIINARYNAQKPTIFSSNFRIDELASTLNIDKAIVERINEMATRAIKLEGDDFRKSAREEKSEFAKKLGI